MRMQSALAEIGASKRLQVGDRNGRPTTTRFRDCNRCYSRLRCCERKGQARFFHDGSTNSRVPADEHISLQEGSIGAFPRRLLVRIDDWAMARRVLTEAGLKSVLTEIVRAALERHCCKGDGCCWAPLSSRDTADAVRRRMSGQSLVGERHNTCGPGNVLAACSVQGLPVSSSSRSLCCSVPPGSCEWPNGRFPYRSKSGETLRLRPGKY